MTRIEHIANLVNIMQQAIKSGDWKVDGACDPDTYLSIAEARLEQEGCIHKNGKWVPDYGCIDCVNNGSQSIFRGVCTGCGSDDEMNNFILST